MISNSLEVNLKIHEAEFDNSYDEIEDTVTNNTENILDAFEKFENDYIKLINQDENKVYSYFYNDVEFNEKSLNTQRFCLYCLIKKVKI